MAKEERIKSKALLGKTIVSKGGKTFGQVGDVVFETRTGELIYLVLKMPSAHASSFDLERDEAGNMLIPFTSVMAIGDFVVISEEDIL